MRVLIPSALKSYTGGLAEVRSSAASVALLLRELDGRYPGFRFRVVDEQDRLRTHIRVSVNAVVVTDLDAPLRASDEVALIMAFSGG